MLRARHGVNEGLQVLCQEGLRGSKLCCTKGRTGFHLGLLRLIKDKQNVTGSSWSFRAHVASGSGVDDAAWCDEWNDALGLRRLFFCPDAPLGIIRSFFLILYCMSSFIHGYLHLCYYARAGPLPFRSRQPCPALPKHSEQPYIYPNIS